MDSVKKYQLMNTVFIHKMPDYSYLQMTDDIGYSVEINRIGVEILELCNGENSIDDICKTLLLKYESNYEDVKELVSSFILDACKEKWIALKDQNTAKPAMNISGNYIVSSPASISIEITKKCPLRCLHCYSSSSPENTTELSMKNLENILDEAKNLGVFSIMLTGGEAFEYKHIIPIINKYASGFKHFIVATNGYYINSSILNKIKNNKNLTLRISLDGDRITHNSIRNDPYSFDRAINSIHLLHDYNIDNAVVMTLSKINYTKLEDTIRIAKDAGAQSFEYGYVLCMGRATKNMELSTAEVKALNQLVCRLKEKYESNHFKVLSRAEEYEKMTHIFKPVNCGAGHFQFSILSDGSISPCLSMPYKFSNIKSTSLTNYLKCKDYKDFFELKAPPTDECEGCKNIDVCSGCFARALSVSNNCNWSRNFQKAVAHILG